MVFVRSASGVNVTLSDGTAVGIIPVAVTSDSSAVADGLKNQTIVEVSGEVAENLIGLSRISSIQLSILSAERQIQ
jgi:hypothetical protein